MSSPSPPEEPVLRAIRALQEGRQPDEKCYFCGGRIEMIGAPPDGPPYTQFYFTCPCKKTSGFLKGI